MTILLLSSLALYESFDFLDHLSNQKVDIQIGNTYHDTAAVVIGNQNSLCAALSNCDRHCRSDFSHQGICHYDPNWANDHISSATVDDNGILACRATVGSSVQHGRSCNRICPNCRNYDVGKGSFDCRYDLLSDSSTLSIYNKKFHIATTNINVNLT